MFKFVVICALMATAFAQRHGHVHGHGHSQARRVSHNNVKSIVASSDDAHAEVLSAASDVRPDGFDYHLETSNAISATASGDANGNINGNFQWISPEGEQVAFSYVADENGYQPDSALLPTPPPIPEAILRAIRYIETHPPKPEVQHGRKH